MMTCESRYIQGQPWSTGCWIHDYLSIPRAGRERVVRLLATRYDIAVSVALRVPVDCVSAYIGYSLSSCFFQTAHRLLRSRSS